MAGMGALVGMPAFVAVIAAAPIQSAPLFTAGTFLIGLGAGLFSHGTLTATMQSAPKEQVGLALGAWGAVQATAAGLAMAIGGVARDLVVAFGNTGSFLGREFAGAATGYVVVYIIEVILLMATLVCMAPLVKKRNARESTQ
jgi:BCD family chlorophyll transporter-like MFS transporter